MNFGVTGANGYVGSVMTRYLRKEGHTVYEFKRKSDSSHDPYWVPYHLSSDVRETFLKKLDGLIHCAYDFSAASWDKIYRINVEGSCNLFKTAVRAGVKKIVFISSMSAFPNAKSMYGKAKLAIEDYASQKGFTTIRPGLVYGSKPGGMVGSLIKTINKSQFIPLIGGGKQIFYLSHEEDLFKLVIESITRNPTPSQIITAAHDQGISFKEILELLARSRNKKISFISIPWQPIFLALKSAELLGFPINFRSDSLISFLNQNPKPDFTHTRQSGISFRPFCLETLR